MKWYTTKYLFKRKEDSNWGIEEPKRHKIYRKHCIYIYIYKYKTIIRYHFIPTRVAIIKRTDNNTCWCRCGEIGTIVYCWREHKILQILCKIVWQFLKWLNIELLYYPAILFLSICPREMKTCPQQNLVHGCL